MAHPHRVTENQVTSPDIREAVGVFDDFGRMQKAIGALETSGFDRRHISVLGSEQALKEQFGTTEIRTRKLEDNPKTPRAANVKQEELGIGQGVLVGGGVLTGVVAAIIAAGGLSVPGTLVPTVLAGGVGGGVAGGVLARLLGNKYAEFFQEQIERGGLLLWVQVPTPELEQRAKKILTQFGAKDIHVHTLPAAGQD